MKHETQKAKMAWSDIHLITTTPDEIGSSVSKTAGKAVAIQPYHRIPGVLNSTAGY